jgi:hypothetical protein
MCCYRAVCEISKVYLENARGSNLGCYLVVHGVETPDLIAQGVTQCSVNMQGVA